MPFVSFYPLLIRALDSLLFHPVKYTRICHLSTPSSGFCQFLLCPLDSQNFTSKVSLTAGECHNLPCCQNEAVFLSVIHKDWSIDNKRKRQH